MTAALIGSESLLGREVRDLVANATEPFELRLVADAGEEAGALTRVGDEPTVTVKLDARSLADARVVFLAGSAPSTKEALRLLDDADGIDVVDLTGALEERPEARLRAPLVEEEELDAFAGASPPVHVIAHPAAIALALFLRRLHAREPIRASVIQIFAPASEHGTAGVEELQQQAISLLSFKNLPRAVFGTQLSFNMLAKYGEEAPASLEDAELRIERHLATLLALPGDGQDTPMPSLRLVQAPVFHGYSFSAWVEFESNPGAETLENTLLSASIEVRGAEVEPPTNVGQAGQSGIAVGAITPDRNQPEACWFWLVADNLRLVAENAIALARQLS
jgi:aspartate-semialdehyde dehydrogenase